MREAELKRITVIKNNLLIVGLKFTYADDIVEQFAGNNADGKNAQYGPLQTIDVDVQEGEILVGLKIEEDHRIIKMIGFTFVRTQ